MAKLLGYDYEIVYGRENSAADSLSRKRDSPLLHHIFQPQVTLWSETQEAAQHDSFINSKRNLAIDPSNNS